MGHIAAISGTLGDFFKEKDIFCRIFVWKQEMLISFVNPGVRSTGGHGIAQGGAHTDPNSALDLDGGVQNNTFHPRNNLVRVPHRRSLSPPNMSPDCQRRLPESCRVSFKEIKARETEMMLLHLILAWQTFSLIFPECLWGM